MDILQIYITNRAIEILKGNITITKQEDGILGGIYEMGISDNCIRYINSDRDGDRRYIECKGGK